MYELHAAMEDTLAFPTWKSRLRGRELEEMGDRFEDIEHRTFGHDGFEDAVRQWGPSRRSSASSWPPSCPPRHWERLQRGRLLATAPRIPWSVLLRRTFDVDVPAVRWFRDLVAEVAATL